MAERQDERILIRPTRVGRPPMRARVYRPNELVRFDARIPARIAQRLYDTADADGRSVTAVLADVLTKAFDDADGAAMG